MRIWNKYKSRLYTKTPLWLSKEEAYSRWEMLTKYNETYKNFFKKMKLRSYYNRISLPIVGFYVQLLERFKAQRRSCDSEQSKTEFEIKLCTNDKCIIPNINFCFNLRQRKNKWKSLWQNGLKWIQYTTGTMGKYMAERIQIYIKFWS